MSVDVCPFGKEAATGVIPYSILHYKLEKELGHGGMGTVYLATDTRLERQVALKFLSRELLDDPVGRSRLTREAIAQSKIKHANVVTVHAVEEFENQLFVVMEYVDGPSLRQLMASRDLTRDEAVAITVQACKGLQAAHDQGVFHRDIKPENILLTKSGEVKIGDFGLARWHGATTLTKDGMGVGTMGYISPEQAQRTGVDHRSDIFAMGIVFYELLCRVHPFAAEHEAAVMYSLLEEEPQPLARYCRDATDEIQRITSRALAKKPEDRYQTAADLQADLLRLSSGVSGARIRIRSKPRRWFRVAAAAAVIVLAAALTYALWPDQPAGVSPPGRVMLAVLPFENLGTSDQDFFAAGVTDEITTRLASHKQLGVVSRTSTIQYQESTKSLRTIGSELHVEYLLEGTVRWDRSAAADKILITPQLIRVKDDTHIWTNRYEASLSNVFAVQASIAEQIVIQLDSLLFPDRKRESFSATEKILRERVRTGKANANQQGTPLAAKGDSGNPMAWTPTRLEGFLDSSNAIAGRGQSPTQNVDAYLYYLRGKDLRSRETDRENLANAAKMYRQALALDSGFALAHAGLATVLALDYGFRYDLSEDLLRVARESALRSLALSPGLPEGHEALGSYYFRGPGDYEQALGQFQLVQRARPGAAESYTNIGYVLRRLGRWQDALGQFEQAASLSPRSPSVLFEQAVTLVEMRKYAEGQEQLEQVLAIAPDFEEAYECLALSHVQWKGDIKAARGVYEKATRSVPAGKQDWDWSWLDLYERDYSRAVATLPVPTPNYTALDTARYYVAKGDIYRLAGDEAHQHAYLDSARVRLEQLVKNRPGDPEYRGLLGLAYAGLGLKEQAIREGERAVQLLPVSKDAMDLLTNLAEIYSRVGNYDVAIAKLEYLLSVPSRISVETLRFDPKWDPLRDERWFRGLVSRAGA